MNKICGFALAALLCVSLTGKAQSVADGLRFIDNEQYINAGKTFKSLAAAQPTASNFSTFSGVTSSVNFS